MGKRRWAARIGELIMKLQILFEDTDEFYTNLLMRYVKLVGPMGEGWHGPAKPFNLDEVVKFSDIVATRLVNGTFHSPGTGPALKAYGKPEGLPRIFGLTLLPPGGENIPYGTDGVTVLPSVRYGDTNPTPIVAWDCNRCRASNSGRDTRDMIIEAVTHFEEHLYSGESKHFINMLGVLNKFTYVLEKEDGSDGIAEFIFKYKPLDIETVHPLDTVSKFKMEVDSGMTWQVTNLRTGVSKVGQGDMTKALNALRFISPKQI